MIKLNCFPALQECTITTFENLRANKCKIVNNQKEMKKSLKRTQDALNWITIALRRKLKMQPLLRHTKFQKYRKEKIKKKKTYMVMLIYNLTFAGKFFFSKIGRSKYLQLIWGCCSAQCTKYVLSKSLRVDFLVSII